jgi:hypothetical protein
MFFVSLITISGMVNEISSICFQKSRKNDVALFEIENCEETTNKSH